MATGWDPQEVTATSNLTPLATNPDGSCANFDGAKTVDCVYWALTSSGVTNIMETDSTDGGQTWGAPYAITSDTGQDYTPYITYDFYHQQVLVVYSKWHNNVGGAGNDLMLMKRTSASGTYDAPVMVAGGDGQSYWEGSALALNDGNIMVSYAVNGPESNAGVYSGFIAVKTSTNNGASFGSQVQTSSLCNAEFPRAIQNSSGAIVQVYSRYVDASHMPPADQQCADFVSNGYPGSDIHQIWSTNDGATWTGEADIYHNPNGTSSVHASIGVEAYQNPASCPSCTWDLSFVTGTGSGTYGVYRIYSTDQWASWTPTPTQYPGSSTWSNFLNINPSMTLTCTGAMFTYTDAYEGENMYNLRYIANSTCSGA